MQSPHSLPETNGQCQECRHVVQGCSLIFLKLPESRHDWDMVIFSQYRGWQLLWHPRGMAKLTNCHAIRRYLWYETSNWILTKMSLETIVTLIAVTVTADQCIGTVSFAIKAIMTSLLIITTRFGHRLTTGNGIIGWMGCTGQCNLLPISWNLWPKRVVINQTGCRWIDWAQLRS